MDLCALIRTRFDPSGTHYLQIPRGVHTQWLAHTPIDGAGRPRHNVFHGIGGQRRQGDNLSDNASGGQGP